MYIGLGKSRKGRGLQCPDSLGLKESTLIWGFLFWRPLGGLYPYIIGKDTFVPPKTIAEF
ncbi:Putative protein [Zobellia galactanivorans]|uniref:Uncharacterized protein n=1 Tax=Zobellia galactanivorans (strain DSM 12802 / CCUG 47099 / CIP 106680 / NCIMB 13871 / Dsij) TaxID=63186 RepID=G0L7E6_ZOBGA|nr:Putative protein [Zobellia galactanivorans]